MSDRYRLARHDRIERERDTAACAADTDHTACARAKRHLDPTRAAGLGARTWDHLATMPSYRDDMETLTRYRRDLLLEVAEAHGPLLADPALEPRVRPFVERLEAAAAVARP